MATGNLQLLSHMLDELLLRTAHLYTDYLGSTTAEEFERDTARAAEEVECTASFEIDATLKDVKERLLGQVSGRTGLQVARRVETTAAVLASDDFQEMNEEW